MMMMTTAIKGYSILLIVIACFLMRGEAGCTRRYTSSEPDCSAARLPDGSPADGHIPCFSFVNGFPTQLEFPVDNAQTCYRTCIDSDLRQCQASLVSSIHNRDLVVGVDFKLWVFSQGFLRSSNQKYRKSSICRYNIQCPAGQILSYSIDFHKIEEPANCGNSGTSCLDSLTLFFPGMASQVTSCGTKEASSINSDGSPNLLLEFMSNRKNEKNGFLLLAWCVDPTSEGSDSTRDTREAEGESRRCNTAAGWGNKENVRKNESAAIQHLADAFTSHSKKILAPSAIHITIDVFGHVTYANMTINITHPNGTVDHFPGVTSLHLANRFIDDETIFRGSAPESYHGYGYIVMWRSQAFFLQDGMNPEFRPTEEEQKLIEEFQDGLKEVAIQSLPAEEGEWEEEEEEGTIWPTTSQWTLIKTTTVTEPSPSPSWTAGTDNQHSSSHTTNSWQQPSTEATTSSPIEPTTSWSHTTEDIASSTEVTDSWKPSSEASEQNTSWSSSTTEATSSWSPTTEPTTSWQPSTEATTSWSPSTEPTTSWSPTTEATTSWQPTTEATTSWSPTTEATTSWSPTTEATTSWQPTTEATTSWSPTTEATTSWSPSTEATGSWSPPSSEASEPSAASWSEPLTTASEATTREPSTSWSPSNETATETTERWSASTEGPTATMWTSSSEEWKNTESNTQSSSNPSSTSTTTDSPVTKTWLTDRQTALLAKAKFYSTACNALLRSVACAYLKLVGGENCPTLSDSSEEQANHN